MVRLTSLAFLAGFVATAVYASSSPDLAAKKERAMAQLSPAVQRYLATLDESEYELDLDGADEDEGQLAERADGSLQDAASGAWKGCKNSAVR